MKFDVKGFDDGANIPTKFAFGKQDPIDHVALSDNLNPEVSWSDLPNHTKSLAIICVDPDVPSVGDNVNQIDKTVPASLPRVDFYHWVLVDIDPTLKGISEGAVSRGVTPKGKATGVGSFGTAGINSYTDWFVGDGDMGGDYGNYDGPCPPWNDELLHHYHFKIFALDIETLGLTGSFTGADAMAAMEGHILDQAEYVGTYTLNPTLGDIIIGDALDIELSP